MVYHLAFPSDGIAACTGDSRYVNFAYLDTNTYVEVTFHSKHFFSMYLCISTPSMSKMVNMKDVFPIIFATAFVEVKNWRSRGRHIVCLGCVRVLPEVLKSSKQQLETK